MSVWNLTESGGLAERAVDVVCQCLSVAIVRPAGPLGEPVGPVHTYIHTYHFNREINTYIHTYTHSVPVVDGQALEEDDLLVVHSANRLHSHTYTTA